MLPSLNWSKTNLYQLFKRDILRSTTDAEHVPHMGYTSGSVQQPLVSVRRETDSLTLWGK